MSHKKHNLCINAEKVFDWVIRPVDIQTKTFCGEELEELFGESRDLLEDGLCDFLEENPGITTECKVLEQCLEAKEIIQPNGRQKIEVTLPSGEEVKLHKVKILVSGKVKVFIFDGKQCVSESRVIDFCTTQTFFLCAPKGTCVYARVLEGECDAELICCNDTAHLNIDIDFCLDVHATDFVKLEIEGAYCKPRNEFPISDIVVCRPEKSPPQCPLIFPGKNCK
ncbi:hypothetical protein RYX56_11985 [Alkalihalophilus lindianensis]|uniref:SipL SPOCS domain-containing protein n=1 Tax=Alkalihalophilus lindianensis TaxID=1630542 RepID=A0ABU3XB24_9BACI|nr:hypothetical protein [Alkalihalophilus lindianensis]MDV2685092.1 hypothetical protein [Alkalihalophilus lindianensis]